MAGFFCTTVFIAFRYHPPLFPWLVYSGELILLHMGQVVDLEQDAKSVARRYRQTMGRTVLLHVYYYMLPLPKRIAEVGNVSGKGTASSYSRLL